MRFLAAAGLVMILTGLAAYYAVNQLSALSIGNLVLGPLLLVAAAIVESRRFRGFSGSRSRRIALRWAAICSAVFAAVLALYGLGLGSTAYLDLTAARQYSLADQTLQLCAGIEAAPDQARPELLLFEDAKIAKDVRLLVSAYRAACPIDTRELKTAEAPPEARAILEAYETTVVTCAADRCEPVGYPSEENITNAILRLVRGETPRAYFTVGHGEANLASEGDRGFAGLTSSLREEGIELAAFVGPSREEVPEDAALLIAVAPARNLLAAELDAIDRYLERGGRLLVLLEPDLHSNLEELLGRWGFDLPDGIVVDLQSSPLLEDPRPVSLLLNGFSSFHPVTRKMGVRTMLLMPGARAVLPVRKPQRHDKLEGLVFTSRRAWVERDTDAALADRPIRTDPDEIRGREIPVVAAGRYPRGEPGVEARIVVVGDHDLASNEWIRALYNRDLVLNAVLWLAENDQYVAIRPKAWTPDTSPLALQTTLAYFYFLAFALPEALLLLGIHAWYRQRS